MAQRESEPEPTDEDVSSERVAVVLSGAGARGAFQAGALSVLIPALQAKRLMPTIWLGTSAGAINASLWGATLHRGAKAAGETVEGLWRSMSDDDVYRPLLPFTALRVATQYALGAGLMLGPGISSAVNTSPLQRTAAEELPVHQLAANVDAGVIDAVGVVATRVPADSENTVAGAASGRSVLFLDERVRSPYQGDPQRALDVVRGPVTDRHVVASSAIPMAFPAIDIDNPAQAAAWYVDGGVRLNAPLQPALGLGATRILLVSATSTDVAAAPEPAPLGPRPDVADAGAQVLHAALADRTTQDLLDLQRINNVVAQSTTELRSMTGRPYRTVQVMSVSPAPGQLGEIAAEVWRDRMRPLGWLRETDNWLLGRGLRGLGDAVGARELLSYLLFDEEYFDRGIELGRQAGAQALERGWLE